LFEQAVENYFRTHSLDVTSRCLWVRLLLWS